DSFIPLPSMEDMEGEIAKMTAATVGGLMTKDVVSVTLETTIEEVANLMVDRRYHTLPVLDGARLVGVIGKEDLLRVIARGGKTGGA
ncbi:MAG: CBS domain-containing protein, partial [Desulfovibrio sp.]|nr:CBS domain-containing protein [Desulfovibrio sp.]